ncbi:MAG: phage tail sheath family protein, partial [Coleofasciculus sp. C2-GNP5-27]
MPVQPTYPGVYIEEIPSGVRTITGVATSITAFVGRAVRGPIDQPTPITSFSDFDRKFGGLHVDYQMSYAVRDFYLNGGSQALIVRLFSGDNGTATFTVGDLNLEAASPGEWGNKLSVKIDYDGIDDEVAGRYGLNSGEALFNLTVVENPPGGTREVIRNVSLKQDAGARRIDRVLAQESQLVRIQMQGGQPNIPDDAERPPETTGNADPTDPDATNVVLFTGGTKSDYLQLSDYQLRRNASDRPIPKTGLYALDKADLFNLLCIPPERREGDTDPAIYQMALKYCVDRRAMLIVDSPADWGKNDSFLGEARTRLTALGLSGTMARNAAIYFPRVIQADPQREGQLDTFVPCGIIAGV